MFVYNVRVKHALSRGGLGACTPRKILNFSSPEEDFEPASANSIVEPQALERPLHFRLPTEFSFGEPEFAWLVRIVA